MGGPPTFLAWHVCDGPHAERAPGAAGIARSTLRRVVILDEMPAIMEAGDARQRRAQRIMREQRGNLRRGGFGKGRQRGARRIGFRDIAEHQRADRGGGLIAKAGRKRICDQFRVKRRQQREKAIGQRLRQRMIGMGCFAWALPAIGVPGFKGLPKS